jgi:sugar phosphate isomerase/epimerase
MRGTVIHEQHETPFTRREFVGTLGGFLAASAFPRSPLIATETNKGGPIGVQLYTVRDEMKKDVAATLARVARIGYREVEFAGYFDWKPDAVRNALRQNGLSSPSSHIGFPNLGPEWDKTIEDALKIGQQYLVCPWIDDKYRTLDGYKEVAELFNKAGEQAKKASLQFGYHNHDFEFKPIAGQTPYDLLITQTDPALVAMEMDVFWLWSGGKDPLDYFKRYPGRFPLLHIKDMDTSGKMADVGKGVIPWRDILAQKALAGTRHIFVEHDEPKDPFASITDSYRYLVSIGA